MQYTRRSHTLSGVVSVALTIFLCMPPQLCAQAVVTPGGHPSTMLEIIAGMMKPMTFDTVERVAISNPDVINVQVLDVNEVLVQALQAGDTSLIVWDAQGQHVWDVKVVGSERVEPPVDTLRRVLDAHGFQSLGVEQGNGSIFVSGYVGSDDLMETLDRLLETFPEAVNLSQRAGGTNQDLDLVKIEVRVIELSSVATEKLGLNWWDSITLTENLATPVSATALALNTAQRMTRNLRLGFLTRDALKLVLNFLLQTAKGRLLAAPNLVTLSGKPAETFLGGETPVITATSISNGVVTQDIEFKEFGTKLIITPEVSADRTRIHSKIRAELRTIDNDIGITIDGIAVPGFKVRLTETEVTSSPDEAVVISGLIQSEEDSIDNEVPKLGSIPFIGRAFRNTTKTIDQTEIVVVVTLSLPQAYQPITDEDMMALEQGEEELVLDADDGRQSLEAFEAGELQRDNMIDVALDEMALTEPDVAIEVLDPVTAYTRAIQERIGTLLGSRTDLYDEGMVRLKLHLVSTGALSRVVVATSSGSVPLEQASIAAAQAQAPYPPFPTALAQPDLWIEFPVVFSSHR